MPEFAEWESFYVIVGSAAGALIGLQFVVLTLIAERPQLGTPEAGAAFATPTIVHFGTARCCCRHWCAFPGMPSRPPRRFGVPSAFAEQSTQSW